jgi:DNA (cytosine-5)-methyltransferase 1
VENVAALLGNGLGTVLGDLAEIGFDAEWHCIPASALGAPHQRDRFWGVARNADCGSQAEIGAVRRGSEAKSGRSGSLADANCERQLQPQRRITDEWRWPSNEGWWSTEPDVGRVAYGVPSGVDRLRALGNAVVPQIPELIGNAILASLAQQEAA